MPNDSMAILLLTKIKKKKKKKEVMIKQIMKIQLYYHYKAQGKCKIIKKMNFVRSNSLKVKYYSDYKAIHIE